MEQEHSCPLSLIRGFVEGIGRDEFNSKQSIYLVIDAEIFNSQLSLLNISIIIYIIRRRIFQLQSEVMNK
jgi:hypothetical protein